MLHNECLNAVGPGGSHLLPTKLLLVKNLDETNLQAAIRNSNGKGRGTIVRFRVKTLGRFDSALVPTGPAGEVPDRWLLAIEEDVSLHDQVALYGHALGHLLPTKLLLVKNLDETNLQAAIRNSNGKGRGTIVRFRVKASSDRPGYE